MTPSLQKIKNVSRIGSFIVTTFLIMLPLFYIAKWILIDHAIIKQLGICFEIKGPSEWIKPWMIAWTPQLKLLGCSADLIGHLPLWLGFFVLKFIFSNYRNGAVFIEANVRYYQYLGWLFLINAIVIKPIFDALMILVVTLHNPPGQRMLSIGFGTTNVQDILWGGFVMIIAWVMLEANRLQEEQELTV